MVRILHSATIGLIMISLFPSVGFTQDGTAKAPAETKIAGPSGLSIIVRMQGPYDATVPLQAVCYFQRTADSDTRLFGAPVELDKKLGGLIDSLRSRGEFKGDAFETLVVMPGKSVIAPERLMLIGLGKEDDLSLAQMEAVGRTVLREAVRMGASRVAFAPLIKDAGNNKLAAGDVENAVVRGMLLAYDTESRLQAQGLAAPFTLQEWIVEAGPTYYEDTIAAVTIAVSQASKSVEQRSSLPYSTLSK